VYGLNILDIFVAGAFAVLMLISWRRGLLLTLYSLFSCVIAIVLANALYPAASGVLRSSDFVYPAVNGFVEQNIQFDEASAPDAKSAQNRLIESLNMPGIITDKLIENNNPEVYDIIGASAIEEYITKLISDVIINIIAMAAALIAVSLILSVIAGSLRIVSRLPVIKTVNKAGGLLLGALLGTLFVWLAFTALFLLFPQYYREISELVETSVLAKYFFETNVLLKMMFNITA